MPNSYRHVWEPQRPYGRGRRAGLLPDYVAAGALFDRKWKLFVGERRDEVIDIVIDFDDEDGLPQGTVAFAVGPAEDEGRMALCISGSLPGPRLVFGATSRGAARMEIELTDQRRDEALLIRLGVSATFDLYVAGLDHNDVAVARVRYADDGSVARIPMGA